MTTKNHNIRDARPEEATILAAAERLIARTPGQFASLPHELRDENFRNKILELNSSRTGTYLVLEDDGIEKFELQVRSSNTRAIKLYKELGFVEEGRKTRRIKLGENNYLDDVYMAMWVGK